MQRLVGPKPESPGLTGGESAPKPKTRRGITPSRDYVDRLVRFIPAEIIGAYIAIKNFLTEDPSAEGSLPFWVQGLVYLVLLVATPAYLNRATKAANRRYIQLAIATAAFVIWSYAVGGPFFDALAHVTQVDVVYPRLAGALAVLSALVFPLFDPNKTSPRA